MAIAFPSPAINDIQKLCPNVIEERIVHSIEGYERWNSVAQTVHKVALYVILTGIACTVILFVAPSLPIIGVLAFAALAIFGASRSTLGPSNADARGVSYLITVAATFSQTLGTLIYTPEMVAIAFVANLIFDIPAIGVQQGAEFATVFINKKIRELQTLKSEVKKMDADPMYHPSTAICKQLFPLYKEIYVTPYSKGEIKVLPQKIAAQIALLQA
jgi:hypothetical protein